MSNSAAAAFSPAALSALRLAMRELPPSIERTSRWKQIAERVSAAADGTRTPRECYEKALALELQLLALCCRQRQADSYFVLLICVFVYRRRLFMDISHLF